MLNLNRHLNMASRCEIGTILAGGLLAMILEAAGYDICEQAKLREGPLSALESGREPLTIPTL